MKRQGRAIWTDWNRHLPLRHLGVGLACVAAALLIKVIARDWASDIPSYVLFASGIAVATWFGGWLSGTVAVAAAGLLVQLHIRAPSATGLITGTSSFVIFLVEAMFFVGAVTLIRRRWAEAKITAAASDVEIARLSDREQELLLVEQAFEAAAGHLLDHACFMLDMQGRVVRWNRGAELLYGYSDSQAVGQVWPGLGAPENPADAELRQMLQSATEGEPAGGAGWMRRADGRKFRGDVWVAPLRDRAAAMRGFAVVVRDLTTEQASEEFRTESIAAREALQGEADALGDQLEAIRTVLDPELSDLPDAALLKELMGRLLAALRVDGVAIVDTRHETNPVVFTASRGLQAQSKRAARPLPLRLRIIQNDGSRARDASAVAWPETVGLMVTVPVARQGRALGALEVITRRARRWTERDALVLLLAADRAAAIIAAASVRKPPGPAATIDPDRLSLAP